jgi:PEGA domain
MRALAATALAACLGASACAPTAKSIVRADGQLAIACNVPEARVYVDDVFRGRAAELAAGALVVPSGARRVEVRADGWFTAYRDVAVPHAGRASVDVALRRVPETEPGE